MSARPLGDIAAPWWTYADIAHRAGLSERTVRQRIAEWEGQNFPRPLPWSRRELRWHTAAVLRWFELRETAARAVPVQLLALPGGRP